MTEPRTEAGRNLLAQEGVLPLFIGAARQDGEPNVLLDFILAIEDEPPTYDDGLSDGERVGLIMAMQRLSAAGLHDTRCPEPDQPCSCGIDAAIMEPPVGLPPVALRDIESSAWGRTYLARVARRKTP